MAAAAALAALAACTTAPPPGDRLLGADAEALITAYGAPAFRSPALNGPADSEQIIFLRRGSVSTNRDLQRELDACYIFNFTREVQDDPEPCHDRWRWTESKATLEALCVLTFVLGPDGSAVDFAAEPAGGDARLAPLQTRQL